MTDTKFSPLIFQWKNQEKTLMVGFDDSMVILEKFKRMLTKKILEYVYMNAVLNVYLMNTDLLN